jgi:hypothetical protein
MAQRKAAWLLAAVLFFAVALGLVGIFISWNGNRPRGVNDLWQRELADRDLEGQTVAVRGLIVFDPQSDFRFNALYLLDSSTPPEMLTPEYGFWFGIGIGGAVCTPAGSADLVACEPFDPTQATTYEFMGTAHLQQVGKKKIMWLSDVDFAHSRHLVDGRWQPIPLGRFVIPLEGE